VKGVTAPNVPHLGKKEFGAGGTSSGGRLVQKNLLKEKKKKLTACISRKKKWSMTDRKSEEKLVLSSRLHEQRKSTSDRRLRPKRDRSNSITHGRNCLRPRGVALSSRSTGKER